MKSQVFEEEVSGQVVMGDVVNQIHHDASRPLTSLERKELNKRVRQLSESYGEQPWDTWRFLHRTIGVDGIEAMRLDHRDSAHAILDLLIERAELRSNGSQPQSDGGKNAGAWTELVVRNGELASQLKGSQTIRERLERRLDEELERAKEVLSKLESVKSVAVKYEKLFANSVERYRQLESDLLHEKQRRKRLVAVLVLLVLTTLAAAWTAVFQASKARSAEARLSVCTFGGKTYAIGSVIDSNPDSECIQANDGRAVWRPMPERPRRSK